MSGRTGGRLWFVVAMLAARPLVGAWDYPDFRCRRLVSVASMDKVNGRKAVGVVTFLTGGRLEEDGRDLRIIAGHLRAPHQILQVGPGDFCRVAFELSPRARYYAIYYGNPKAKAPGAKWEPQVGLRLETRRFRGGDARTLKGMRRAIANARPVYGRDFVAKVFHGYNLFGPSDRYVSVYTGWLYCRAAGDYGFLTTSDDISYLLIDGRVRASKTRWGGGRRRARFRGRPVKLTAGYHRFEYLHVEGTHQQAAVAAWQPPGAERAVVIPDQAFPGVQRASLVEFTQRGQDVSPDVSIENVGEVEFQGRFIVRVRFRDRTTGRRSAGYRPRWDFGDGTTSTERNPQHIYLRTGLRTVALTLRRGDRAYRTTNRIDIQRGWRLQTKRLRDTSRQYAGIIKTYDLKKMPAADLPVAIDLLQAYGHEDAARVGAAALLPHPDLDEDALVKYGVLLGQGLRDRRQQPDQALDIFRFGEKQAVSAAAKAEFALQIGDTYLFYRRDGERASAEYRKVLTTYAKAGSSLLRRAQVRLGDVFRRSGDREKAREAYLRAEGMVYETLPAVVAARAGAYAQTVEEYLRREDFAEASKALDRWEWERPTEKLRGATSLLRARLAAAQDDLDEAIIQAEVAVKVNPAGNYAAELLLHGAEWLLAKKQLEQAQGKLKIILDDHAESGVHSEAVLLMGRCLLRRGQTAEAVRTLSEFAGTVTDDEYRPRALLLLSDGYLRLKDQAKAAGALRTILAEHPASPHAEPARRKLKGLD